MNTVDIAIVLLLSILTAICSVLIWGAFETTQLGQIVLKKIKKRIEDKEE